VRFQFPDVATLPAKDRARQAGERSSAARDDRDTREPALSATRSRNLRQLRTASLLSPPMSFSDQHAGALAGSEATESHVAPLPL